MPSIHGPLTLGELIASVEATYKTELEEWNRRQKHGERGIYIDWNNVCPKGFASYRGYYDHLAIGFEDRSGFLTVDDFLAACKAEVGKVHSGWKGGDYQMSLETPVWVANTGCSAGWGVKGVKDDGWAVVIETEKFD